MMKTYTSKPNEDLGQIARKFGLPSWKYLYQLNKDKIGDNPDLLKEGTVLQIPQWDSTGGDEKIKAKGADPFEYTGGLRYAYPWAPMSFTITDKDKNKSPDFTEEREIVVQNTKTKQIISRDKIKLSDSFEMLVPGSDDITIGIEGFPLERDGIQHRHPNDDFSE
jgi:hypothetical protein